MVLEYNGVVIEGAQVRFRRDCEGDLFDDGNTIIGCKHHVLVVRVTTPSSDEAKSD